MSNMERKKGIERIRALLGRLEREEEPTTVLICWCTDNEELQSMQFGHPLVADAMLVHLTRVAVLHRGVPSIGQTETKQ